MKDNVAYLRQRKYFKDKMINLPIRKETYGKLKLKADFYNVTINDLLELFIKENFDLINNGE